MKGTSPLISRPVPPKRKARRMTPTTTPVSEKALYSRINRHLAHSGERLCKAGANYHCEDRLTRALTHACPEGLEAFGRELQLLGDDEHLAAAPSDAAATVRGEHRAPAFEARSVEHQSSQHRAAVATPAERAFQWSDLPRSLDDVLADWRATDMRYQELCDALANALADYLPTSLLKQAYESSAAQEAAARRAA